MSGGSLYYLYIDVQDAADTITELSTDKTFLEFARTLSLVSNALRSVELAIDGDTSEEAAYRAIHTLQKELQYDDSNYHND